MAAADLTGALTARTRELLREISQLAEPFHHPAQGSTTDESANTTATPATTADNDDAATARLRAEASAEVEKVLTPRLMEILEPQHPEPTEVAAIHGSLESLQNTLGAAYMLLAAEAKAETLQAELSACHGDLTESMGSSERLIAAHEQCVADYSDLRAVVESAREEAEALAAALASEGALTSGTAVEAGGGGTESRRRLVALLGALGSSVVLPSPRPAAGTAKVRADLGEAWTDDEHGDGDDDDDGRRRRGPGRARGGRRRRHLHDAHADRSVGRPAPTE